MKIKTTEMGQFKKVTHQYGVSFLYVLQSNNHWRLIKSLSPVWLENKI